MNMGRNILIGLGLLAGAAAVGYGLVIRPWWRQWGSSPEETSRTLPGDDLIPVATGETRAITIDAGRAAIWPWLVQMGYGRGGWYTYETMGMEWQSADRILPEHQELAVGDVMPTHPGGGFVVNRLDPGRALVLYLDSALVQQQAIAAKAAGTDPGPMDPRMTEALATDGPIDFAATWAFVLDELPSGRTRLIERFRFHFVAPDQPWTRYSLPFVGFGLFIVIRRQLLNLKARAEGSPAPAPELESVPV
jgi:hypothetical protein